MWFNCKIIRKETRDQQVEVLTANPGNLSLIPRTHVVKEKNQFHHIAL